MSPALQRWIPPLEDRDARLRLVCLPYAGGGAAIFRPWMRRLPSAIEVVPVRLPGREDWVTQSAYTRLGGLVEALSEAVLPVLSQPYAFFGHSMGALVAYELVRALRRKGLRLPDHLFVSGRGAPHTLPSARVPYDLPEPEFVEALVRLNKGLEVVAGDRALLDLLLPTIRADFELCQTYAYDPEPPLPCPITAFGGRDDEDVPLEQVRAWRVHTTAGFTVREFPGDHFFVNSARRLVLGEIVSGLSRLHGAHATT